MGMAGIAWWTSDIGGFHGGTNTDPSFRECLVRWFQLAVFSPVLRMHGDREPHEKPLSDKGGGLCTTGASNEMWSFGDQVEAILGSIYLLAFAGTDASMLIVQSQCDTRDKRVLHPPAQVDDFPFHRHVEVSARTGLNLGLLSVRNEGQVKYRSLPI
jgi:hypothetical protein